MDWTEHDIPNLENKTIIITGANSGIGYEATRLLSKNGAHVIMACRSMEKAQHAFDQIRAEFQDAKLTITPIDLSSFHSIHQFSEQIHKKYDSIDILLNNAGVMMTPYQTTTDGLEWQQGINHFGHFLLTSLLFDLLKNGTESRIVNISSLAHKGGKLQFSNVLYENGKGYNNIRAYSRSKLENLLFTYELADRIKKANLPIKVVAAHPGVSKTNLGNHIQSKWYYKVFDKMMSGFNQSAYQGSLPGIRAAVDPEAVSGTFYGPDARFGTKGHPVVVPSSKRSHDKELMKTLWDFSEQQTKTDFKIS